MSPFKKVIELIFTLNIVLLVYVFIGYPFLLFILTKLRRNVVNQREFYPFVSVIIAARNEEKVIGRKIENSIKLDYPRDRFEIIVASDASTDGTNDIVRKFSTENSNVKLVHFDERSGKTFIQNESVKIARGQILIFSDATTDYKKDLLKKITRNFFDERVGAVASEVKYLNTDSNLVSEGNNFYWEYEKLIKILEGQFCSLIGVTGCCYAVRKDLYEPISPDLISDFVTAQIIYKKRKLVIYEKEAIVYEKGNEDLSNEFNMRVRVAVRSLYGLWCMRSLLNPFKYGFFSIQLISHKILRYLVPIFLFLLLSSNFLLVYFSGSIYLKVFLASQVSFYFLAFWGGCVPQGKNTKIRIFFYFLIAHYALLIALFQFLKGERKIVWNPNRHGKV